jgi:hypothetical protein
MVAKRKGQRQFKEQQKQCVCEEGIWTPTLTFGGASNGIAYARQEGYYRKIGSLVVVWYWLALSSKGTSSGTAFVENLPFPAAGSGGMTSPVLFFGMAASFVNLLHSHDVSPHRLVFQGMKAANTDSAAVRDTDFSNVSNVRSCVSYFAPR